MFHVEKMAPKDFPFAVALANAMDWNMTKEDFAFNLQMDPDGCLVLYSGTKRAGVATCINYGQVGWFGNLVVDSAFQKQGAGTQLVQYAITYLKSVGVRAIGLYAYDYLQRFYGQLGFVRDCDFLVLKAQPVLPISADSASVREAKPQDTPNIIRLDQACFGGSRKKVLEPILSNPNNARYVAPEGDVLSGYVAAKVYAELAEVGPLVCPRNRPKAAADLLKTALNKVQGAEAYLYLPASETELLAVAAHAGFRKEFSLVRMFLGSVDSQDWVYIAESLERG
jgi:ribosomal protein S18 acetylase RimI-like enzyme